MRMKLELIPLPVSDVERAIAFYAGKLGFTKDVEMMRASGLARGGSMDTASVVDNARVQNAGDRRYEDEVGKNEKLGASGNMSGRGTRSTADDRTDTSGKGLTTREARNRVA